MMIRMLYKGLRKKKYSQDREELVQMFKGQKGGQCGWRIMGVGKGDIR